MPSLSPEIKTMWLDEFQWHIVEDSLDMCAEEVIMNSSEESNGVSPWDMVEFINSLQLKIEKAAAKPTTLTLVGYECLALRMCLASCSFFIHELDKYSGKPLNYRRAARKLEHNLSVTIPF